VQDGGVSDRHASLVGRAGERRLVSGLFDDVRAGHGRTCLIFGEAGIGNTTLVQAVAADAAAAGLSVHWGRCTEAESVPYWPWAQLLGELLGGDGRALFGAGRYAGRADLFGGHPTGTVMRTADFRRIAAQAGWADFDVVPIEHPFWCFYRLSR
jgi:AAA ATPase domain